MAASGEERDPQGGERSKQPGGAASRGPNPDPGGETEPSGLVPPYADRTGPETAATDRAESVERQLAASDPGVPGQTASPADEQPVSDSEVTDAAPESAMGVGVSSTRRAEDMADDDGKEPGRHDVAPEGESQRPVGVSDDRDASGVDPGA